MSGWDRDDSTAAAQCLARAREIAPLIAACAEETERRRRLSEPVVTALIDAGLYRMLQPRSQGGAELAPADFMAVIEEVAKADASFAWCLAQCTVSAMASAYLDRAVALEIFGPRGILAWGPPAPSQARSVPGGYRVTGKWNFASGCRQATWLGAHLPISEADGTPRRGKDGAPVVRSMLFPAASAEIFDVWQVMGLRGTASDSYAVTDLFVPEQHSVARDSEAERREAGPLYRLSSSNVYALGFGALALGVARGMLDAFLAAARAKPASGGAKRAMRDNNHVQFEIGRSEARLRAARAYLFGAVAAIWRKLLAGQELTDEDRIEMRLASTWAIHEAAKIVEVTYHLLGATAVFASGPFERRFRDIHTVTQQLQGRDAHYEGVGQILLGLEADIVFFST